MQTLYIIACKLELVTDHIFGVGDNGIALGTDLNTLYPHFASNIIYLLMVRLRMQHMKNKKK